MVAPILVFAVGNESRGDDALGPLLLRELEAWLAASGNSDEVELLEDFQLQVEHAMDMEGRSLVLFIDAGMDTPAPYSFSRIQANAAPVLYSHALVPEAVLKVYEQVYNETSPDVFVLCICGERFELGEGLSAHASKRLSMAFGFASRLLLDPEALVWDSLCTRSNEHKEISGNDVEVPI